MRSLIVAAALLGFSALPFAPAARASTLFELPEPNDCPCDIAGFTTYGTEATTAISGFLGDGDVDLYPFIFSSPVGTLVIAPSFPDIVQDDTYRVFDLAMFSEFGDPVAFCDDCWYEGGQLAAYDLPAGLYYVGVADWDGLIPAGPSFAPEQDLPPESRGLGAYGLLVNATATPEPASLVLMASAVAGLVLRRRLA